MNVRLQVRQPVGVLVGSIMSKENLIKLNASLLHSVKYRMLCFCRLTIVNTLISSFIVSASPL